MPDINMPRLSDSMEEGTIVKWLKSDGDEVSRGEELVEIETDKATMTYEADQGGVLAIVAGEGDTLPIGEVIARIGADEPGEDGSAKQPEPEQAEPEQEETPAEEASPEDGDGQQARPQEQDAPVATTTSTGADSEAAEQDGDAGLDGDGRIKASPVARRVAREQGLDIGGLSGSGPGGRIVKADVEAAARSGAAADAQGDGQAREEPVPAPAEAPAKETGRGDVTTEELTRTQEVIARRMAESKATVPHFGLQAEVDMEEAVALRQRLKEVAGDDPVPSFNDMIVKACALALREFPRANGAYKDGKFQLHGRVNIGVAVAGQDALVVPTIFDADEKSLGEIARIGRGLAGKVREGKISPPELSGGTFTVSNLGMYGITSFTAVINPPQAAILAVGSIEQRPAVHEDQVVARHRMVVTLACDHRILYGADAAQFLGRVRERLEQPLTLAL